MGSPFGNIEVRGARENNPMSYTWAAFGLESVVTWTLTPCRGPTCAWSSRASGRISSRPTRAPVRVAGVLCAALEQVWARID
jgi:hypothetical protein